MSQQINLFDPALLKPRELFSAQALALAALALSLILGALGGFLRWQLAEHEEELAQVSPKVTSLQTEVRGLEERLKNLKPDAALEQELAKNVAALEARTEVIGVLEKGLGTDAMSFSEVMRGFARQTPNGVWLVGFKVNSELSAMEIRGRTQAPALVPEYIRRLNNEKTFKGLAFSALSIQAVLPPASASAPAPASPVLLTPPPAPASPPGPPASSSALDPNGMPILASLQTVASQTVASLPLSSQPAAALPPVSPPVPTAPLYHEFVLSPVAKLPSPATEAKP